MADVVVVGAGIAGVATAFFVLRSTSGSIVLVERDHVARGASGHNAGQLTTYFERALSDIADEFGTRLAADAQQGIDDAHALLDTMVDESRAGVRVERFMGYLGMFNRQQLEVHLRSLLVRREAGLPAQTCVVSEEADFLAEIAEELGGLYSVVPQARVRELLEVRDDRYRAVLAEPAGCSNSGLLCQQVLEYLQSRFADRFVYADHTKVERVLVASDRAVVETDAHSITAARVVLCTNGFVDHAVQDATGMPVRLAADQEVTGRIAYMVGFAEDEPRPPAAISYIRNLTIGGDTPYVYVTRRTYDRADDTVTLTCMGGPEYDTDAPYRRELPFPREMLTALDDEARPFAQPSRSPGQPYDFHWHGLMGYNDCGLRVVGPHPRHPRVLYNLGCNGVGFLPSIYGGDRIARQLAGERLAPSVFDPRAGG